MDMSGSSKTDLDGISIITSTSQRVFNSLEGTMNNKIKGMGLDLKVTSKLKLFLD